MADVIAEYIASSSYLGVFALMVLENVFPPIPSEIILPFVGFSIANGTLSAVPAVLAATAGSVLGTALWFLLGWFVSTDRLLRFFARYGAYVAISANDFTRAANLFKRYEIPAVFLGRMVPTVRSVVSIPAGSVRMRPLRFLFFTTLGTLLWNALLIGGGYILHDDIGVIEAYLNPVANTVIILIVLSYLFQITLFHIRKRSD